MPCSYTWAYRRSRREFVVRKLIKQKFGPLKICADGNGMSRVQTNGASITSAGNLRPLNACRWMYYIFESREKNYESKLNFDINLFARYCYCRTSEKNRNFVGVLHNNGHLLSRSQLWYLLCVFVFFSIFTLSLVLPFDFSFDSYFVNFVLDHHFHWFGMRAAIRI